MGLDSPYFHADRPAYAEVYQNDTRSTPTEDYSRRIREKDRSGNNAPPPPATNNFSPQVATLSQSANIDIRAALVGNVDFDNFPSAPRTIRQIPPSKPRRADQAQSRDHDALKKEAHRLALEIRRHKQRKLLIEAGLVKTDETEIEEIENRIEEFESRLKEIAGASPVVSAVVRKKAIPLTEVAGEYTIIEKLLARKRSLQEKFYQAQSDRQKRNLQKHTDHINAELAAIFTVITQNQETAENGGNCKNNHESEKRFRETGRLIAETRTDLRLVSRKFMLLDASKKADELRQTLRVLSNEQEDLVRPRRMRLAQIKRENDRREKMRRYKACPEFWDDEDGFAEQYLDNIYDEIDFQAYEDEYRKEFWGLKEEEEDAAIDELAAFFEHNNNGDGMGWDTIYGGPAESESDAEVEAI